MSKKLKKFLNDAEKTESKIAELEEYLRNVRAEQKKEEDIEIVPAIRCTTLGARTCHSCLCLRGAATLGRACTGP